MRLVVIFSIFVLLICEGFGNEETTIKIKNGKIRGLKMTSEKGNIFFSFRGIPYAEPPVDDLRFRAPVGKKPWGDDVLDATEDGPVCPQIDFATRTFIGQENNCLVLNVYSPQLPNGNNFRHRAVMVFIHGGAFIFGMCSSSFYDPKSIMDNDIVLVTINYRLGPLGFLSTGDETAPGNYGLLDQTKALEWVKENIAEFGGDIERITIFGESAGAGSVVYQVISPLSRGLFHRAIAMSGSSLCLWALQEYPLIRAQMLGRKFPCPIEDNAKLIKCLREASVKDIMQYSVEFTDGLIPVLFTPNIDNTFLTDTPYAVLSSGKFNKNISFMSGITKDDGAFLYAAYNPTSSVLTENDVQKILDGIVGTSIHTEHAVKMIREKYLRDADISNEKQMRNILIKIYSHGLFHNCHYQTSRMVSQLGIDVFAYQYDYATQFSTTQAFGISDVFGVSHFDDLYMLFDGLFMPVNMTEKDKKMRSTFQTLFTNFAKYGHPTHKKSKLKFDLQWQPFKNDQMTIYHIDDPIRSDVYNPDSLYEFWTRDIPEAMKTPFIKAKDEL